MSDRPATAARGETLPAPAPARFSLAGLLREYSVPLLFMAPVALTVAVFFLIPVVLTLLMSLTNMSVATSLKNWSFIGLGNFSMMFKSPYVPLILKNTAFYVVCTLVFNVVVGLVLSILTTMVPDQGGMIFRTLWLLPRISPSVVYALCWQYFTAQAPFGILAQFLGWTGIDVSKNLLHEYPWLFVILINGFVGASFGMIIFTSAIRSIPKDYYLAAEVDGASTWQQVRRITLPMLRWPIMFVMAYQTLSLLTSFEYILLTTNGGPGFYMTEVWALYAYHMALSNYFGNAQFGFGAALASILVTIGLVASVLYLKYFRFGDLMQRPKIEVN